MMSLAEGDVPRRRRAPPPPAALSEPEPEPEPQPRQVRPARQARPLSSGSSSSAASAQTSSEEVFARSPVNPPLRLAPPQLSERRMRQVAVARLPTLRAAEPTIVGAWSPRPLDGDREYEALHDRLAERLVYPERSELRGAMASMATRRDGVQHLIDQLDSIRPEAIGA